MYFIWILIFLINFVYGLNSPHWILEQIRDEYKEYDNCIEKRKLDFNRYQNSKRFHAIFAPQNSLVTMQCFEWLSFN